jgi:hypothetical protein
VLHGHSHRSALSWLSGPTRPIPLVGVPSASSAGRKDEPAGYKLYDITDTPQGWRCESISRGLAPGGTEIVERERRILQSGAQ